jgi:membrane protein
MPPFPSHIKDTLRRLVLETDPATLTGAKATGVRILRLTYGVGRDLATGQLTLRAMSLVYTTLLSLVPLLAFSFSVLKGFGVHNQMEPLLTGLLGPLGEKGAVLTTQVIGFVENMNVRVLGAMGLGLLVFTVVSLMQKIEEALNFVWRIKRRRSLGQRFSGYLSVVLVGPLLMFSAMGVTASLMNSNVMQKIVSLEPLGTLVHAAARGVPYLLVTAAFAFVYVFIPNTKVRTRAALIGGLVAGILWETVGWGFGAFVVSSTQYTAIYSTFAILVMFMIWLFVSWLILLVGASVAFYIQHPTSLMSGGTGPLMGRMRERMALSIMVLIGRDYLERGAHWSTDELCQQLGIHLDGVEELVDTLSHHGLLLADGSEPPRHLPARDLDAIHVTDVLEAVRTTGDHPLSSEPVAEQAIAAADRAVAEAFAGQTIKSLLTKR